MGKTTSVFSYPDGASPYGIFDMAGNVSEWTRSVFNVFSKGYPYDPNDGREEPKPYDLRALRGGAFVYGDVSVRCASRDSNGPNGGNDDVGFRVVMKP